SNWLDVEGGTWIYNPAVEVGLLAGGRLRLGARAAWLEWLGRRRWVGTGADGYPLFGELHLQQLELTVRGALSFTRDFTLQVFSQFLRSAQRYPSITEQKNADMSIPCDFGSGCPDATPLATYDADLTSLIMNAVLRWEFLPGSTLYLVYTHNHQVRSRSGELELDRSWDALTSSPADNLIALKLSYLWAL